MSLASQKKKGTKKKSPKMSEYKKHFNERNKKCFSSKLENIPSSEK